MGFMELFKPTKQISAEQVKEYLSHHPSEEYCLLDVRQPAEYEQGHLPGARLIPLGEVAARADEMDPERLTIVYCRSGNRSNSAAALLVGAGHKNVLNMEGGMMAYNGITASGGPEAGMFCFPESLAPGDLAAVAWFLERGSQEFLSSVRADAGDAGTLIGELILAKDAHKESLLKLYEGLTGLKASGDFPREVIGLPGDNVMAGCVKTPAAIEWARSKTASEVLELMLSLEANTLDLYLKLGRMVKSGEARSVFQTLAQEQEVSLNRIAKALESALPVA